MQYRAIATDLDGTLLRGDKTVSARTRAAIDAAEDAGLLFIVATGRPPRWIEPVVEQIGHRGLVVCANGASVYDPAQDRLIARTDIAVDVAVSIVDDVERAFPTAVLGVEQGMVFSADTSIEAAGSPQLGDLLLAGLRVGPIRSFLDEPVTKLIIRLPEDTQPGAAAQVQALVGDRALVTHSTTETFLELSHPSVHKASTVERLLGEAGIAPAETVAFGDMPNDLELIRWAGLGVAVANAHPILLAEADEVTASNEDDGVALVIERILAAG
ncbi:HAD family hydrolase [Aquihabitans sp. McL0605]|uniref:HAD family hydrolase n=1 Tax=Aquihabitans sp. McL0605 TaxID=3415671 RepID=UPI003CFB92FF